MAEKEASEKKWKTVVPAKLDLNTDRAVPVDQSDGDRGKYFSPTRFYRSKKRILGNGVRRSHQCGYWEKEGILVENWSNEENDESKKGGKPICTRGRRSVLGMLKQRPFQMKDVDDREQWGERQVTERAHRSENRQDQADEAPADEELGAQALGCANVTPCGQYRSNKQTEESEIWHTKEKAVSVSEGDSSCLLR